ncbi:TonB-dependent receptor [Edaphobacter sp.]|uniref:TonB-dependent receptor n=1 Tax=Edaphobacter sp. TaxID=1934404 RepID=UPI002DB80A61|nr:carboxypeptidase regulatory-like domain-containing protein [Edaphobacter sp.]HEU5340361.1 carboxypeptidase regulatory-like domain-containing protein [Edaphobacter sp.]
MEINPGGQHFNREVIMRHSIFRPAHLLIALLIAIAPFAMAQVSTGTIAGDVTDSTGAAVSNATVLVTNTATGVVTQTVTGSSGLYNAPNLQPGPYIVSISAPGFSQQIVRNIELTVGAQNETNFVLKVGAASEKIVVTSAPPQIDMVTSTTMPVVNQKTIVDLPLNGRDWTQLASLQPGVAAVRTQPAVAVTNQRANRGVGNQLTVGGARPQQNNYRVDGISINDYSNGGPGGVIGSNLGVDAIQEFSVVTSNASADYGKTAGGIINAVTRSGTNRLHGSAYEFFRNSALDARNEFDAPGKIAEFRRNQFGVSAGGPIIKDHTFLFGDYEGLRQYQGANTSSLVPNADARSGLLCQSSGGNPCASKKQFAVNSAVAPYFTFYPSPNSGTLNSPTSDVGAFLFNDPFTSHENYFTIRVDHKISDSDSLNGTYFYDNGNLTSPDPFNVRITGNIARRKLATIGESHVFSANLLNSIKIGYSGVMSDAPTTLAAINPAAGDTSLGFVPGIPVGLINIGGVSNFQGGLRATGEFNFRLNSYQLYDDVYFTHGKHSLKFGFAFERLQNNQLGTANPNGQFIFSNLQSFVTNNPSSFNAPLAQGVSPRDLRQSVFGGYVNDNYRLSNNLTLNLGVRYEPVTVPTETANRIANLVNLTDSQPRIGNPYFNNASFKNIAPRVGFAWDPFGKSMTSIHGGYGIYDAQMLNYLFEGLSIFTAPYLSLGNNAAPGLGSFPKGAYAALAAAPGTSLRYSHADPNPKRSYVQEYSFNIQQQLPYDFVAEVGYAGSRGTHLPYRVDDVNTVQPVRTNGGYFFYGPNGTSSPSPAALTAAKLNPNVGQISALFMTGYSHYNSLQASLTKHFSRHTQFQASYTWAKSIDDGSSSTFGDTFANSVSSLPIWAPDRRRGVSDFNLAQNIVLNYLIELPTISKSNAAGLLVNGWQWGGIFQASTGEPFTPQISGDSLNLHGNDNFAFPDRITGNGCSGNPVQSVSPANRHYVKTSCFAFPSFDAVSGLTHLGTAARNSIIGPGLADFDTSLVKNTKLSRISESATLQFRAELFNVLNHVNYATPPKSGALLFGQNGAPLGGGGVLVGPTASSSRQAQFALKLLF